MKTGAPPSTIYKIVPSEEWEAAKAAGTFAGSGIDLKDGYIHFSTADQVRETARRHFAGRQGLLLVAVDTAALGEGLTYEPSRGGDLFPHLYAAMPVSAARWASPLPLDPDGGHVFPELTD